MLMQTRRGAARGAAQRDGYQQQGHIFTQRNQQRRICHLKVHEIRLCCLAESRSTLIARRPRRTAEARAGPRGSDSAAAAGYKINWAAAAAASPVSPCNKNSIAVDTQATLGNLTRVAWVFAQTEREGSAWTSLLDCSVDRLTGCRNRVFP